MELLAYVSWGRLLGLVAFTVVTIFFGLATSETEPRHVGWIAMILLWAVVVYIILDTHVQVDFGPQP